jgi:hypothetical protein
MSPLPNFDTEFLTFLRPPSREIAHMQVGQCGKQTGTKSREVVCDENGIGGGGE